MDLEKRVNMLEQEVQILKNEIQATLLDIQSQLLTNAHPMLRTSDHGRDENESMANPANITAFRLPNAPFLEEEEPDDASTLPSVRRVNLGDLGNNNAQPQPQSQPSISQSQPVQPKRPQPQQNHAEFTSQDDYEAWVKAKLNELGFQRTRELILLYQDTGRFDYDTSEMLLRLIMLYAPRPNHADSSKQRLQKSDQAQATSQRTKRKKTRSRKASSRPKAERRPSSRPQTERRPSSRPQAEHRPPPPQQERMMGRNTTAVKIPVPNVKSESEDDEGRGVVLKLIAGVQSAGIGLKRGLTGSNG